MIFGLSIETFTLVHVIISLVAIASGLLVVAGWVTAKPMMSGLTELFLATTLLTSLTGFAFPINGWTPALVFGVISLVALAVAISAKYGFHAAGPWRLAYITGAMLALYLNAFVAVFQAFLKIPALTALAPTQSEPPFAVAQAVLLLLFIGLGVVSVRRDQSARY